MRSAMEIMVFLYVHVDAEEICHYMMHGLRREALLKKYSLWHTLYSERTVPNYKETRINIDNRKDKISPKK